ncbi:MAG TPA: hypothetical protein VL096_03330, partial [Pirellulaceae bacterium]|nr:hypothetical protein [Pirellulaceae bacterium]
MASGTFKRTRTDRTSGFVLPPGQLARTLESLRRGDVLLRFGLAALAALFLWLVTSGWSPPFAYRTGFIPARTIVARVKFERVDTERTADRDRQKRSEMLSIYEHDQKPLLQLQQLLRDNVFKLVRAESFDKVDKALWQQFYVPPATMPSQEEAAKAELDTYTKFREAFAADMELANVDSAIKRAMEKIERDGLLETPEHKIDEGSLTALLVHPVGDKGLAHRAEMKDVRIAEATPVLEQRLFTELRSSGLPADKVDTAAALLFHWIKSRLPVTLKYDPIASKEAADKAIKALPPVMFTYLPGETQIAAGGKPLNADDLHILSDEYIARVAAMSWWQSVNYSFAVFGMYVAMFTLCGTYIYHNHRYLLTNLRKYATLLGLVVVTVILCCIADDWRAEMIPLVLFGMTVSIAYKRELALLLSASVAVIVTITAGYTLPEFIILSAAVAAAVLLIGRIRSRTKLIYIGAATGAVAMLTAIGVGTLAEQALGSSGMAGTGPLAEAEEMMLKSFATMLFVGATWFGFCGVLCGLLMTGLLPFIERLFDIQTDISLLELGDIAHPLLQELVRRAPGTYNHSINVASIADAAAEAIGANGLL